MVVVPLPSLRGKAQYMIVLKSTDGGVKWVPAHTGTALDGKQSNAGEYGTMIFLTSADGGVTWTPVETPTIGA